MPIEIVDIKGNVLYTSTTAKTLKDAVIDAVAQGANLTAANLASEFRELESGMINVTRRTNLSNAELHCAKLREAHLSAAAFG